MNEQLERNIDYSAKGYLSDYPTNYNYSPFDKMPQKPDKETGLKVDVCKDEYVDGTIPAFDRSQENWDEWTKNKEKDKTNPQITTLLNKVKKRRGYEEILALAGLSVEHQENAFDRILTKIEGMERYVSYTMGELEALRNDIYRLKELAVLD